VPLIGGLYARRLETTEAVAAIAAGVSALVALQLWNDGAGVGPLPPPIIGLAAAALACALAMMVPRSHAKPL
jgi:hypothetical protein